MQRPSAFTLIEILVANAAMALLMTAVLAITASIAKDSVRMERGSSANSGLDARNQAIAELIRHDLLNAKNLTTDDNGRKLVMEGFDSLSPSDGTPVGQSARIEYFVQERGGCNFLLRRQTLLNRPEGAATWTEIVSSGVQRVLLIQEGIGSRPPSAAPSSPSRSTTVERGNIFKIQLILDRSFLSPESTLRHNATGAASGAAGFFVQSIIIE